ncbi:MAG: NAD(P)-dependent oxidoreductase [Anaerolineae bacterium]|jgi:phosphoglycerate dehydrogenase-like enzyme
MAHFTIGLSPDFRSQGLAYVENYVRDLVDTVEGVEYVWLPEMGRAVRAADADQVDAVLSLGISWPASSFEGLSRLALIARWGVGYDMIDVDACTAAGVALAITPGGIGPSVAEGAFTLVLALLKRVPEKDRAVRQGLWRGDLPEFGHNTSGIVLGTVGLGNIGSEFMRLARVFRFPRLLAYDPYVAPEKAKALGVELVDLDTLMAESDVVAINCLLNEQTRGLIGARQIALMKPTAYLVNTARGPIVDQAALTAALQEGRIAGAGLDVLAKEPPDPDDPILKLDNVIFAPHAIAWTTEMIKDVTEEACRACLAVARGEVPAHVVNRTVLDHPLFRAKLDRFGGRA